MSKGCCIQNGCGAIAVTKQFLQLTPKTADDPPNGDLLGKINPGSGRRHDSVSPLVIESDENNSSRMTHGRWSLFAHLWSRISAVLGGLSQLLPLFILGSLIADDHQHRSHDEHQQHERQQDVDTSHPEDGERWILGLIKTKKADFWKSVKGGNVGGNSCGFIKLILDLEKLQQYKRIKEKHGEFNLYNIFTSNWTPFKSDWTLVNSNWTLFQATELYDVWNWSELFQSKMTFRQVKLQIQ